MTQRIGLGVLVLAAACTPPLDDGPALSGGATAGGTLETAAPELDATGPGASTDTGADVTSDRGDARFDVGAGVDLGASGDRCVVADEGSGLGTCTEVAPPDAFEPAVQWTWTGDPLSQSWTTPLVANLTDDDGNGTIDLCDVPDVVVVAFDDTLGYRGNIVVLSGDDGREHFQIPMQVDSRVTPALGDIDGDGLAEIVTITRSPRRLVAFEHDGAHKWTSPADPGIISSAAPALADLDGDGSVEIMMGGAVYEPDGSQRWDQGVGTSIGVGILVTAADLDGDDDLEVVYGASAFHHDGTPYYETALAHGFPHVADLDGDAAPEVLLTNPDGMSLIEHDGTVTWQDQRPTGDPIQPSTTWLKPGTVHDFDADGRAEFATGSANHYAVYEIEPQGPTIKWQAPVLDTSGSAGGTAFDFDGDGEAEAMYADETQLFVFDGEGGPLLTMPRQSGTFVEYPVVADIDNDGSAEIVVVSNYQTPGGSPTVQAIRDVDDRWIQARRIWNQHTYHVTNVREDGTIPSREPASWTRLNTFRTNAQIEGGGVCRPEG